MGRTTTMKMKKKEPFERTKVVIRHLPPSLSQSDLFSQFGSLFSHRCNWLCFRLGSQKKQRHSRAYIDFKSPEDVRYFADFFHGHLFVNEKGTQFKATVEYAPSQHVPRPSPVKDIREGTIYTDPDYLEFLKLIAKPVDNLPSAEIQLERKEAEQAGAAEETLITTPLMEFVRQRRAAERVSQGSSAGAKVSRRSVPASLTKLGFSTTKKGFGKKKGSSICAKVSRRPMPASLIELDLSTTKQGSEKKKDILKGSTKKSNRKEKSTMPSQEGQSATSSGKEISVIKSNSGGEDSVSGITVTADCGKKKILLLKGKEREISHVSEGMTQQSNQTSAIGNSLVSTTKINQRSEASEGLIRKILLKNEACQNQSSAAVHPQQKFHLWNLENDKQPPLPVNKQVGSKSSNIEPPKFTTDGDGKSISDDKFVKRNWRGLGADSEKRKKHSRNKDRLEDSVYIHHPRSGIQLANVENLSSTVLQQAEPHSNSAEVSNGGVGEDMPYGIHTNETTGYLRGHNGSFLENDPRRPFGPLGAAHHRKGDGSLNASSKRRGATGHTGHEKQIWVQKKSSGS